MSDTEARVPAFRPPAHYPTDGIAQSLAGLDFDSDGDIDLLAAIYDDGSHNGYVALLENIGNGSFTAPVKVSGTWQTGPDILVADLNQDGNQDYLVVKLVFNGPEPWESVSDLYLYHGDGVGGFTFQRNTSTPGVIAATVLGDVNGDGRLDLITTRRVWSDPATSQALFAVELGQADGAFGNALTRVLPVGGNGIARGHLNDDAFIDLVVTTASGYSLLLGNGDGTFAQTNVSVAGGTTSPAVGDFNGDGNTDLPWRSAAGESRVWTLDGTTVLSQAATNSQAPTAWKVQDVADFNGDGKADILWRHDDGATFMWFMDGTDDYVGAGYTNSQTSLSWHIV
ncbi:hypothetical protein FHS95_000843 [Sphingomonas naasensis]|uniref:VCBS repeat-containing protein n=1 Tax=Sphingomonas naasensis TaxID=1344951 RepID=A0A4V3QXG5_9SPHN|nr:VCBS repeat-containing protein [Sphingomonas naasensis]NIJ19174.1 hypothetical protein [Sphingomonas naasensis]TGX46362.1 VCBS repeat-containing protein [Sphingomonas naasensis]